MAHGGLGLQPNAGRARGTEGPVELAKECTHDRPAVQFRCERGGLPPLGDSLPCPPRISWKGWPGTTNHRIGFTSRASLGADRVQRTTNDATGGGNGRPPPPEAPPPPATPAPAARSRSPWTRSRRPGAEVYYCQNFANPFGGQDANIQSSSRTWRRARTTCSSSTSPTAPAPPSRSAPAWSSPRRPTARRPRTTRSPSRRGWPRSSPDDRMRIQSHYLNTTPDTINAPRRGHLPPRGAGLGAEPGGRPLRGRSGVQGAADDVGGGHRRLHDSPST